MAQQNAKAKTVAALLFTAVSPALSFVAPQNGGGRRAVLSLSSSLSSSSTYSSNGQTWGPEGTVGNVGEPAAVEDQPAAAVPDGTLWSFTGRLRTDEGSVRQEFGGKRAATFNLDVQSMPGITRPTGFWDPLGFSKIDDETLLWYKHSELKHGRVCMLAFTGWWLNELGVFFPNMDTANAGSPLKAWEATSARDKGFILTFCLFVEWFDELRLGGGGHYLTGGPIGLSFLPLAPRNDTAERAKYLLRQKNAEINNGRLAMLGIASFFAAETIPGSVPFIPKVGGAAAAKAVAATAAVAQVAGDVAEAASSTL